MDSESHLKVSSLPGVILSLFLFGITVLAWPGFVEKMFSLDWRIGNMRPVAYGLQATLGSLTVVSLLARRRIDRLFAKTFPTRRRLLLLLAMFSLSLILSLMLAEMGLRLLDLSFKASTAWAETPLAQFDPVLGWSYIPSRSVFQEFGIERRRVVMHFDDIGSRVRTPGVRHVPAAPTVLLVGDSYTMGHGLPYEETFSGRLESMPDFPFQVVNLGVQAYGTDQSLLMLKHHFKKFNTKAVVYGFLDVHILRNSRYDRRLINPRALFLGTKPQFALKPDGTLYLSKTPVRYEDLSYLRLLALFQVVLTRRGPKPSVDVTRALVKEMKNYVESNGATFFVIHWDQGNYWDPPPTLRPGESPFRGMNLHLIDTRTNPPPGWSTWKIPGDGHPDARAHAYVAHLLVEEFKRNMSKSGNAKAP